MTENEAIRVARQEIQDRMGEQVGIPSSIVFHQRAGQKFNLPPPFKEMSCYEVKFERDPIRRFIMPRPGFLSHAEMEAVTSSSVNVIVFDGGDSYIMDGKNIRHVFVRNAWG